jgi:hypothetical protein
MPASFTPPYIIFSIGDGAAGEQNRRRPDEKGLNEEHRDIDVITTTHDEDHVEDP